MKKTLLTAAIALTGLAAFSSANANYANGDLFLGVEDTSGTITKNLVIDLGNFSSITSLGNLNIASDLTQVFGTGWTNSTTLAYGIYGITGNTAYLSAPSTGSGVSAGQYPQQLEFSYASQKAAYGNLGVEFNSALNGNLTGGGTTANGVFMLSTDATAWSPYASGVNSVFNDSNLSNLENGINTYVDLGYGANAGLDIYANGIGNPNTQVGTYTGVQVTLDNTGAITAVPEPATYALFGLGALLLVIAVRRKSHNA